MLMIVKSNVRVSRLNGEVSIGCRDSMLAHGDDLGRRTHLLKSYNGDVDGGNEVNYDDNDNLSISHLDGFAPSPTFDASCQRSLVEPEEKSGRHNQRGTLKYAGSKFPSTKESLASRLSSIQREFDAECQQPYDSCKDSVVPKSRIRGEYGGEKTTPEFNVQRDIDAAHALMEMANEGSHLHKNDLLSSGKNYGVNGMLDIEVLIAQLNEDEVSHDTHSLVAGKKKHSRKFRQLAVEDKIERHTDEMLHFSLLRKKKRKRENDFSLLPLKYTNYNDGEKDDTVCETHEFLDARAMTNKLGKKRQQNIESRANDGYPRPGMLLVGRNYFKEKQKVDGADMKYMEGQDEADHLHSNEATTSMRSQEKLLELDTEMGSLAGETCNLPFSKRGSMVDAVSDRKITKKQQFPLITPTIHTGFSFSIIHLLSAVRTAMVTPHAEDDTLLYAKHPWENGRHGFHSHYNKGVYDSKQTKQRNLPCLTIHEIVQRVRSNPGDPHILETHEPLQDLVRGVLKIFSSKTAPLGAKGWTALAFYNKFSTSWSWIGPLSSFDVSNHIYIEEEVSPEAWGLPHRMLVKLVDSYANWLKESQMTLQQIGSLPAPPVTLMQPTMNVMERFKDLKAQKSLTTISPSSEEVRAYFRREEILRYLVPEKAFSYTAADGKKSTVAPLRRCSGKPSSKPRDHYMLKADRPPHVTILCLVRDAAARLPGSIGTRADVCILIRDSQFIVEDVSDTQINQVVSGALDRLHYELDPCVQFDKNRQLWVYLHRERDEDDFEYDGTSTTKKWKRKKRNVTERSV